MLVLAGPLVVIVAKHIVVMLPAPPVWQQHWSRRLRSGWPQCWSLPSGSGDSGESGESGDSGWVEQYALSGQNRICSGAGDSAESGESGDSNWVEQYALSGQNWICSGAGDSAESGESADSGWVDFG